MDNNTSNDDDFTIVDGTRVYIGPERRTERRRRQQNKGLEIMLKNFSLDRRTQVDRRREDTSWLLTSQKAANE